MPRNRLYRDLAVYSSVIVVLPVCLLGGGYVGYQLDQYWETSPWLTILGLLLGSVAGFDQVFRLVGKRRR